MQKVVVVVGQDIHFGRHIRVLIGELYSDMDFFVFVRISFALYCE